MDAVQAMTGRGGWPMLVYLSRKGEPFYAGTYFPNQPRHGMPSFRQVLNGIAEAWQQRRSDVKEQSGRVTEAIGRVVTNSGESLDPDRIGTMTAGAVATLRRAGDQRGRGFGGP